MNSKYCGSENIRLLKLRCLVGASADYNRAAFVSIFLLKFAGSFRIVIFRMFHVFGGGGKKIVFSA
jgi:hypothetical protein